MLLDSNLLSKQPLSSGIYFQRGAYKFRLWTTPPPVIRKSNLTVRLSGLFILITGNTPRLLSSFCWGTFFTQKQNRKTNDLELKSVRVGHFLYLLSFCFENTKNHQQKNPTNFSLFLRFIASEANAGWWRVCWVGKGTHNLL